MLLSPTASLWFFNHGDVFTAVPLFYPAARLGRRARHLDRRHRPRLAGSRRCWPAWVLLAATVFLAGFRIGLNVEASNVIDVGYSGVIGAERIVHGQAPWGNFPIERRPSLKACGPADAVGRDPRAHPDERPLRVARTRRATRTGRSRTSRTSPATCVLGWSGKWDTLPAAHFTSIAFDLLCMLGLWLVGRRFGGQRLAATLAFAWAAYPVHAVRVELEHERRAACRASSSGGSGSCRRPVARGAFGGALGLDEVRVARSSPRSGSRIRAGVRASRRFAAGFAVATLAAFSVVLLEPSPLHELRVFWDRTVGWQVGRDAPWSLWDWGQYHARGLPDLHVVQRVLQVLLVAGAVAAAFVPAPQVAAPARRAHRCAARRLRARADVLALHVHPVVLSPSPRSPLALRCRCGGRDAGREPRPRSLPSVPAGARADS